MFEPWAYLGGLHLNTCTRVLLLFTSLNTPLYGSARFMCYSWLLLVVAAGDFKREDLARTVLEYIIRDLVQTTRLVCRCHGIKRAFFAGGFCSNPLVRSIIASEYVRLNTSSYILGQVSNVATERAPTKLLSSYNQAYFPPLPLKSLSTLKTSFHHIRGTESVTTAYLARTQTASTAQFKLCSHWARKVSFRSSCVMIFVGNKEMNDWMK